MNHYDIIIVGGGVIGKSIAFRLREQSLKILCIDPSYKANGSASLAAGAMLGAFGEITHDKVNQRDVEELEFRILAQKLYPAFLDEIEDASHCTIYRKQGTFVIANQNGQYDRINVQQIGRELQKRNRSFEWVETTEIPHYHPNRKHVAHQALFIPDEGSVNSTELLEALTEALKSTEHITLLNDTVKTLHGNDHRVSGVVTESGEQFAAQYVILCAGVGIQKILNESRIQANLSHLMPGKGVAMVVDTETEFEHVIRTPNREFACGTHIVPRGRSSLYIGATNRISNTPGLKDGITTGEVHNLLHSAIHELNTGIRTANVQTILYGSRPITTDRFPLIGKTDVEGLMVATGTYRNGVLMAPLIGEILFDELMERPVRYANPFSPRNRSVTLDRVGFDMLISGGVKDLVSFIQEPGGQLPYNRTQELEDFVQVLLTLVLQDGEEHHDLLLETKNLLSDNPVSEIVPQLFYRFHQYWRERS